MGHRKGDAIVVEIAFHNCDSIGLPLIGLGIKVANRQRCLIEAGYIAVIVAQRDRDWLLEGKVFKQRIVVEGIQIEDLIAKLEATRRVRW